MIQEKALEIARRQHGVVTRHDLRDAGFTHHAIARLSRRGLLERKHRGVYLLGAPVGSRSKWMAAVLAAGRDAVLSHSSAALCWDLIRGRPKGATHVTIPADRAVTASGIQVHRSRVLSEVDRTVREGIPITTPARTIVDLASRQGGRDLERVLARADRDGLATHAQVEEALERRGPVRGNGLLRQVLDGKSAAFTRSEAEDRFLALVRQAALPEPRTNVSTGPWELDFLWPDLALAVEVDGFEYHRSRTAFENDRKKDLWLRSRGITVLRFTWRQISERPLETVVFIARVVGGSSGDGSAAPNPSTSRGQKGV